MFWYIGVREDGLLYRGMWRRVVSCIQCTHHKVTLTGLIAF